MYKVTGLLALILLTSCAGKAPVVDNSSKNPTAVYSTKGKISGFVLPDSTFTETVFTRDDRRKSSTKREYDSWMARQFLGNTNEAIILRMDRDIRWTLINNDGDKTYTECPLAGCAVANMKMPPAMKQKQEGKEKQFDYDPNDEQASACPIKLVKNSFKVTATGKTREIAGQLSKEYKANWITEYKDNKGRVDRNHLKMEFWNAQPGAEMKKVWAINEKADKAYLKKIKQKNKVLAVLIPDEIFATLSAFTGKTLSNNKLIKQIASEMEKAKGYPMSTKVEWYLDRKACVEPQKKAAKESGLDWTDLLGSVSQKASDMVADKAADMFLPKPDEPIFSYFTEVLNIGIRYEHDSVFDVPADYKLSNKK